MSVTGSALTVADGWEKTWLEEQVPVLHGRTPRQAAISEGEDWIRLESLLRQFEYWHTPSSRCPDDQCRGGHVSDEPRPTRSFDWCFACPRSVVSVRRQTRGVRPVGACQVVVIRRHLDPTNGIVVSVVSGVSKSLARALRQTTRST